MNQSSSFPSSPLSRRQVVKSGMVLAGGLASPFARALAAPPSSQYIRYNVTSAQGQAMLADYQTAIGKLLKLPPTDPRNWYRNAFVHLMDCPHMNWWLYPWHRAYIGWFEQTCREMSGNPRFTFPYWDWTATPMIPTVFGNGLLNPSNSAFISSFATFQSTFSSAMNAFWASLTPQQIAGLKIRGYNSMSDVWGSNGAQGAFFTPSQARSLAPGTPFTGGLAKAVSLSMVQSALQPQTYVPFSSSKAPYHQGNPPAGATFGLLESEPHNLVHNGIGGFMEDFLSPVDPIFFMHHSNLERLWVIWTEKQEQLGKPTLPTGSDLQLWSNEPFTFFHNASGDPVRQNKAGNYSTTDLFNYTYTPGSNSDAVSAARVLPLSHASLPLRALLKSGATSTVSASLTLPAAQPLPQVAHITVSTAQVQRGQSLDVFLNLPAGVTPSTDRPEFLGSLQFFGMHHHAAGGSITFTLPISPETAAAAGLKAGKPLHLQIVPSGGAPMLEMNAMPGAPKPSPLKVTGVSLGTS